MGLTLKNFFWILFFLFFYLLLFLILSKKKKQCFIIFNSYYLLLSTLISSLVCNIILLYSDDAHMNKNYPTIFIFAFYFSSLTFFISYSLRIIKMIQSMNLVITLTNATKNRARIFYSKRYSLMDNLYFKFFAFISFVTFVILIIHLYRNYEKYNFIPFYTHSISQIDIKIIRQWVWIKFFESFILVTIIFKLIAIPNIQKQIKIILCLQIIIYLAHTQLLFFANMKFKFSNNALYYMNFLFSMTQISLVIIYPSVKSKKENILITTLFNPRLVSDFYLFISDEICYYAFSNYLSNSETDKFLLKLYIEIMKFKFKYTLEAQYNNVVYEAKKLYNKYFGESSRENKYLSEEILANVRKSCQMIDKGKCDYEMFDSILVSVYGTLCTKFSGFKITDEYKLLVNNLNMNSYIQYKILDTPSINTKPLTFI